MAPKDQICESALCQLKSGAVTFPLPDLADLEAISAMPPRVFLRAESEAAGIARIT